ncbi:MAG TPA: hypothetical protein VMW55_06890 [Nitrosopumilaceae archaeon]|nr:hypothetical protein [Nitrosopumilaceae archaeon]
MEGKLKISFIVVAALVAGITGTLAVTSLGINSNLDAQNQSENLQTLGMGANVLVEAYNNDGELYYNWEGHNILYTATRNAIVGCMTGEYLSSPSLSSPANCVWDVNYMSLLVTTDLGDSVKYYGVLGLEKADLTLIPEGCDFGPTFCTGWELRQTFDMMGWDGLCPSVVEGSCQATGAITGGTDGLSMHGFFNSVDFGPFDFVPTDRVIVTMTFDVPE